MGQVKDKEEEISPISTLPRQKTGETIQMIRIAEQIQALCKRAGVSFIINDRVDVAIASHAAGDLVKDPEVRKVYLGI